MTKEERCSEELARKSKCMQCYYVPWASLVAQSVKNLPEMRETGVRSLGLKDSLEKEITNYSSILAMRIPWTEEPDRLQSMGSQKVRQD